MRNTRKSETPEEAKATPADLRADAEVAAAEEAKAERDDPVAREALRIRQAQQVAHDANKRTGLNYTDKAGLIRALTSGVSWAQAKRLVCPDVMDAALEATRAEIQVKADAELRARSGVDRHDAMVAAAGVPIRKIAEQQKKGIFRTGIDGVEQDRLVRCLKDGMDWEHACRAVLFGSRVDPDALERWRVALEARAKGA